MSFKDSKTLILHIDAKVEGKQVVNSTSNDIPIPSDKQSYVYLKIGNYLQITYPDSAPSPHISIDDYHSSVTFHRINISKI